MMSEYARALLTRLEAEACRIRTTATPDPDLDALLRTMTAVVDEFTDYTLYLA